MGATERPEPSRNARIVAVLCQLWCWLGPFLLLSLVIRITTARTNPFLRQVTGQVLNLQIVLAAPILLMVVFLAVGWNLIALVCWLLFAIVLAYGYVIGLIGAWKSGHGIEWVYPLNLRIIPD